MSTRKSSAIIGVVPASRIIAALAEDLSQVKREEGLTYPELGEILGKSDDQAAKYCDGTAEMPVSTYYRAKQAWNGRFTGRADTLVGRGRDDSCDRGKASSICRAQLAVSVMLEDDTITDDEIRQHRKALEEGRDAFEKLLSRIGPKAARA